MLAEVDSTLNEAARRFDTLRGPTWILALHQTAARGRRGRDWRHPAGNFAATFVLPGPLQPATAALRSFVASLALYDAFAAATGRPGSFALKWPNDVLLNGGKVAGMLLETIGPRGDALSIEFDAQKFVAIGKIEAGAVNSADFPPCFFRFSENSRISIDRIRMIGIHVIYRAGLDFADIGDGPRHGESGPGISLAHRTEGREARRAARLGFHAE